MGGGESVVTSEINEGSQAAIETARADATATLNTDITSDITSDVNPQGDAADLGKTGDAIETQQPAVGNAPGEGVQTGGGEGGGGGGGGGGEGNAPDTPSEAEVDTKSAEELAEDTSQKGMEDALEEVEKKIKDPKTPLEERKKLNERRDKLREGIKEHKELNRSDLSKWMRGKGKSGLDMTQDIVKDSGGFKLKNIGKILGMIMLGGALLVGWQMQSEGECKKLCKSRKNPKGKCSDPNIPEANCPPKETDCDTYCENACSQENRVARSKRQVADDPGGVALGALGDALDSPFEFWDTFKYVIMGIGTIIILIMVYKFSTAWVSGKAANMTIRGTTRGLGNTDIKTYNERMNVIKQVNG